MNNIKKYNFIKYTYLIKNDDDIKSAVKNPYKLCAEKGTYYKFETKYKRVIMELIERGKRKRREVIDLKKIKIGDLLTQVEVWVQDETFVMPYIEILETNFINYKKGD